MADDTVLKVEGVSKKFCRDLRRSLWYGVQDIAGEIFGGSRARSDLRAQEFWALKDVSFELKRGEILGLIGANGAGKSTLLKILNGLIRLDQGSVTIRGGVQALIELGTGFNPILTGRENVFVNAALLGIPKETVKRRFDEIVEFSGIGGYIDSPVQFYSSGMKVRLGFSVVLHLDPDLLLVDEVLSVGDASFVNKAQKAMLDLLNSGISVIIVSHGMANILQLCDRCLWLDRSSLLMTGPAREVVEQYLEHSLGGPGKSIFTGLMERADLKAPEEFSVDSIRIEVGEPRIESLPHYHSVTVTVECTCSQRIKAGCFSIGFYGNSNVPLAFAANFDMQQRLDLASGNHLVTIDIPLIPFRDGRYFISLRVSDGPRVIFRLDRAGEFVVPFLMDRYLRLGSFVNQSIYLTAEFSSIPTENPGMPAVNFENVESQR